MAMINKTLTFKNAVISKNEMTITEITKDEEKIYSLENVLSDWDGVPGVCISIKQSDELPEDGDIPEGNYPDGE